MSIATEIRIGMVERLISEHYEPECHRKCYLNVWRHFVFPQMGISQRTFTRYLKIIKDREESRKRKN